MSTLSRLARLSLIVFVMAFIGILLTEDASAQNLQYAPYGAWRGRAVARDGLFRVQRYHWGMELHPPEHPS